MSVQLITYTDESMTRAAGFCLASALTQNVDAVRLFTRDWLLSTEFYEQNKALMDDRTRGGGGYFAWKPFVISEAIKDLQDGDYLIYSDAGVEFIDNQKYIIDRMDQDVFVFGNMWEHAHWCKADIVTDMWPRKEPLMISEATRRIDPDVDRKYQWWRFGKQAQASVIFFRVSDYSRKFVTEWLEWCLFDGGRLVDDSPSRTTNHPEFQENRWDQAILTTLAYREGIKLHWWPAVYNRFTPGGPIFTYEKGDYKDDYPPLYHHHRLRDWEWRYAA